MSAPTGMRSGAGFRSCVLFALDAAGLPAATSETVPYEGVKLSGAKVLTVTDPEPRKIFHTGDDSIVAKDMLPPLEGMSAELHAGKLNDVVDALLSGQLQFSVGDIAMFGGGTDKRGFETQVGLLGYQHAPDADVDAGSAGTGGWNGIVFPKAYIFQRETGFNDQPADRVYSVMPMTVAKHLWGPAFTTIVEGFLSSQYIRTYSVGRPKIIAFKAAHSNPATMYAWPVGAVPLSITKVKVYVIGVIATPTISLTTGITFSPAPAIDANITAVYEY